MFRYLNQAHTHLFIALLPLLCFACDRDNLPPEVVVNCDDLPPPVIGASDGECVIETSLDQSYDTFRSERSLSYNIDDRPGNDVDIVVVDNSYGVAGPPRGHVSITPGANISISTHLSETTYCEAFHLSSDSPPVLLPYGPPVRRLCTQFTEEELMQYDTVVTTTYTDRLVSAYLPGTSIDAAAEWSSEMHLLYDLATQPGQANVDEEWFLLFKRELPGEPVKYGWLGIRRGGGYGQYGEFTRAGFME